MIFSLIKRSNLNSGVHYCNDYNQHTLYVFEFSLCRYYSSERERERDLMKSEKWIFCKCSLKAVDLFYKECTVI